MSYNNGFPLNSTYQQVMPNQNIGYTSYNQNYNQINQQTMPRQSSQFMFNQIIDDRIKVNGIENASLYPIAPNTTATLWDIDDKTFYRLTAGLPIKVYEYKEKDITSESTNKNTKEEPEVINKQNDAKEENLNKQILDLNNYVKKDDLKKYIDDIVNDKLKSKLQEKEPDASVMKKDDKITQKRKVD